MNKRLYEINTIISPQMLLMLLLIMSASRSVHPLTRRIYTSFIIVSEIQFAIFLQKFDYLYEH